MARNRIELSIIFGWRRAFYGCEHGNGEKPHGDREEGAMRRVERNPGAELLLAAAFSLNIEHGRWWLALGGIASLVFGILLVIQPFIGAVVLTLWIGAYALVFGVFLLVLAFQLYWRKEEREVAAAKKA